MDESAPEGGQDGGRLRGPAGDRHDVRDGSELLRADGNEAARQAGGTQLAAARVEDGRADVCHGPGCVELCSELLRQRRANRRSAGRPRADANDRLGEPIEHVDRLVHMRIAPECGGHLGTVDEHRHRERIYGAAGALGHPPHELHRVDIEFEGRDAAY